MKKPQASASTPPPLETPLGERSPPAFSSKLTSLPLLSPIPAPRGPNPREAAICQPPHIPDHELIRCIGGGSYGEVWLARSVMDTYRAVKIVRRHTFDHARPFEREFAGIQKFEPLSRSHEGLVDLLQVGRNDAEGYFYYVMELADAAPPRSDQCSVGQYSVSHALSAGPITASQLNTDSLITEYSPRTLRSLLRPDPQPSTINPQPPARLPLDECIQIGRVLTNALTYLHGHGLVHRDLKPSNIIFVGGVPKLADVGLVAGVDEARSYVGTEGFIPPEGPGSPPADLYSLGIVLYVMSTGKSHQDFPEPLADLATQPDHARWLEFNTVIHKACRAEVRERYQTAEKMHADLELLCAGKSVKRLHLVERRLALLTRISGLMVLLAVIVAGILYQTNRARRIATQNLVRLHVGNGTSQMNQGDFFGSLVSFTEALRLDSGKAKREESHRTRIASVLRQCPKLVGVFQHEKPVNEAVLSPDDRWLITGSDDHTAKVWDLASGTNRFTMQHPGAVYSVGFSPDGALLVTTSTDQRAHLWRAATGAALHRPPIRNFFGWSGIHQRFSSDSTKLLTRVDLNTLQVWNVTTGEPIGHPLQHERKVAFFAFSPDGRRIVSGCGDNQARVWDSVTGALRFSFRHGGSVNHAAFSPDSSVLATACSDGLVRFWDLTSGKFLPTPLGHRNGVDSLSWSPEGNRLLTKSWDNSVQVWDVEERKPLSRPITHAVEVFNASFDPDGRRITTFSGGNLLRLWDAETGEPEIPSLRHSDWRQPVTFSSDGRLVVTIHREEVRVWDIGTIEPPPLQIKPVIAFKPSSVSLNGHFKVTVGGDNSVGTTDLKTHQLLPQLIGLVAPIRQAFFSRDSEILLTENAATRARAWDPARGEPLTPLLKTEYSLEAKPFSKGDLPRDDRPVADLVRLAQLLARNRIDDAGGFRLLEAGESLARWKSLQATYPEAFRVAPSEVLVWHEQEAKTCEQAWNWGAAIFHLHYLIEMKPEGALLRDRLAYAQTALENASRAAGGYLKQTQVIPPRNPLASAGMVDLSGHYNVSLKEIGATFPNGLPMLAGTAFDVRGMIQLPGRPEKARGDNEPEPVVSIKIGRKCRYLHFLHATAFRVSEETRVGTYVIRYADHPPWVIPIDYGKDVRNWWTEANEPLQTQSSALAWMGSNPQVQAYNKALRIFKSTWENPLPENEIVSLDFIASRSDASPILVAITMD